MTDPVAAPDRATLLEIFTLASRIKLFEERMRALKMNGDLPTLIMLYSPRGQEILAAAMGVNLRRDDYVITTYRGMHDSIAKGVDLKVLWAEFLGKATGTCEGKGGPMHVTDPESGLMVTTGIVGAGMPIANGFALATQMQGGDQVTVVNFGDGATNIGAFHEALNMASLWKLPVVFLCQNNLYAEHTSYEGGTAVDRISRRAEAYSMVGVTVDGNDPVEMYKASREAVERARAGEGPTLIEAMTYRFWGHAVGDSMEYMPKEERQAAMDNDPMPRFRASLIEAGHATEDELAAIEADIKREVEEAKDFALASPDPEPETFKTHVYSEVMA